MDYDKQKSKQRSGLIPFKPGQSGNPKGRPPKTRCIPDFLRNIGESELPPEIRASLRVPYIQQSSTFMDALLRLTYVHALRGESWAVQFIAERTEGKPSQPINVSGTTPMVALITNPNYHPNGDQDRANQKSGDQKP